MFIPFLLLSLFDYYNLTLTSIVTLEFGVYLSMCIYIDRHMNIYKRSRDVTLVDPRHSGVVVARADCRSRTKIYYKS